MQRKLVPGCQTPVKDGTVIVTDSDKVRAAQKATLEYLLLNHPLDCPICDQAGECFLQDYSYQFGRAHSRLQEPKEQRQDKHHIGDQIALFTDRCIMCTRCVRFTREISGTAELQVINRGSHEEIDIFPGQPCNNKLAGNVVDLCPVGALCSKDFLYQQRVWWLKTHEQRLPGLQHRLQHRRRPEQRPGLPAEAAGQPAGPRLLHVRRRPLRLALHPPCRAPEAAVAAAADGQTVACDWDEVLTAVRGALARAAAKRPSGLGAVLSPWMTLEEAYLAAQVPEGLVAGRASGAGPGASGRRGRPLPEGRARPGRRAGEVRDPGGEVPEPARRRGDPAAFRGTRGRLRGDAGPDRQRRDRVVVPVRRRPGAVDHGGAGGRIEPAEAADRPGHPAVARQCRSAHFVLPGGAFAERDGTFVNHAGLAQAIHRAIAPPDEAWPDGRILWQLAGRRGLFHAPTLRQEMAQEIPALAAAGWRRLGRIRKYQVWDRSPDLVEAGASRLVMHPLLHIVLAIGVVLGATMFACAYLIWLERKLAAWIQDRIGPNRVGPFGLLQPLADGAKFLLKEDVVPAHVDKVLYFLAPSISVFTTFIAFSVVPFGPSSGRPGEFQFVIAPQLDIGILFIFAAGSLAVYGVILGGWASNNKYSMLGALRSSAQVISYEIPLGMSLIGVILLTGSLNLEQVISASGGQRPVGLVFLVPAAGVPDFLHERAGRVEPAAVRPAGMRAGTGGRLPHRIQCHEVRDVLPGRVHARDHGQLPGRDPVLRRLAFPVDRRSRAVPTRGRRSSRCWCCWPRSSR